MEGRGNGEEVKQAEGTSRGIKSREGAVYEKEQKKEGEQKTGRKQRRSRRRRERQ